MNNIAMLSVIFRVYLWIYPNSKCMVEHLLLLVASVSYTISLAIVIKGFSNSHTGNEWSFRATHAMAIIILHIYNLNCQVNVFAPLLYYMHSRSKIAIKNYQNCRLNYCDILSVIFDNYGLLFIY